MRFDRSLLHPRLLFICIPGMLVMVPSVGCRTRESAKTIKPSTREESPPSVSFTVSKVAAFDGCTFSNGKEAAYNCILEIVGGGVGCVDYDRDGCVDLFFPRGGAIHVEEKCVSGVNSALLRGDGGADFAIATEQARIQTASIYSHGISAADFDHDGFTDLLVYGFGGVLLYQNLGDGTFVDVTQESGLAETKWITAVAWLDVDGDQNLDLYLGSYVDWSFENNQPCQALNGKPDVCSPNVYDGSENLVYRNNADGSYRQELDQLVAGRPGKSLGVLAAEFCSEQGVGLYVANDLVANFFFTASEHRYSENAFVAGVAVDDGGVANGSMGLALLDFNQDERFDIFVTNFENEKMGLYLNADNQTFHHSSREAGLNRKDLSVVAFGVVAADFDGDTDEDIVYTSGHVQYFPDRGTIEQLPKYLENKAGEQFLRHDVKNEFFTQADVGRGLATADFNGDGRMDFVATHLFSPPMLLTNTTSEPADWLTVELVGVTCPRTPIGAVVELSVGDRKMVRQVYSGGSYLSQSQQLLHFSWPRTMKSNPSAKDRSNSVRLTIRWPDGNRAISTMVAPNQHLIIAQDVGSN